MLITLSGNYGSGKSTVANILAKKLNLKHLYTGSIMRDIAKRRGISLIELQEQAKTDLSVDKEVDARQIEIGKKEDNFVIEGHIAYHFVPNSYKIFLQVSLEEGAKRVYNDKSHIRETETYNRNLKETIEFFKKRLELTRDRWYRDYGTDFTDLNNYDLVIDTTNLKPEQVTEKIIDYVQKSSKS